MGFKFLRFLLVFSIPFCSCNNSKEKNDNHQIRNILILGNSIVEHAPLPEIGWNHDWGMAASARDSDFVHRLKTDIHLVNPSIKVAWENISAFERDYENYDLSLLSDYRHFDMIIIKISENVTYKQQMEDSFIDSYKRLLKFLSPNNSAVIVIVEGFWPTPVNDMIKQFAIKNKYPFIPLADLYEDDKSNAAIGLFDNEGVGRHPSDKGMRNIALRIWKVISTYLNN